MLAYTALIPDSPLLIYGTQKKQFPETPKSFQRIVSELKKREIRNILTIASAPMIFRHGFSVWVHPEYEASFAAFGDLTTKSHASVWWNAYSRLRSANSLPIIEPIDTNVLEPSHAVVIHTLHEYDFTANFLCLNDAESASNDDRKSLGQKIRRAVDQEESPCAIFILGSMAQTKSSVFIPHMNEENTRVRNEILDGKCPSAHSGPQHPDLLHETVTGPLQILEGVVGQLRPKEYSYEKSDRTSFFVAEFDC